MGSMGGGDTIKFITKAHAQGWSFTGLDKIPMGFLIATSFQCIRAPALKP